MSKYKLFLLVGFLVLIIVGILSAEKKFYDADYHSEFVTTSKNRLAGKTGLKEGDLIFQKTFGNLSMAIQLATHSEYSHCGIIYKEGNDFLVYEAIGPVKFTPLDEWAARGEGGVYVVKRLKNADQVLTEEALKKLKKAGEKFKGKEYDNYFEWTDERIYCSELLWKMYYQATGLEIGKLQKLKDFDLTSRAVKEEMKERYGNKIPRDELVISPISMLNSELLVTVQ